MELSLKQRDDFSGCTTIMTMIGIGWDRYNVIVLGMKGKRLTFGK